MSVTTDLPLDSLEGLASRLPAPGTVDVTIEVIGEDVGDQIQVQRLPWNALVYDETSGVLELSVGSRGRSVPIVFRHEIHDPQQVWVEEEGGSIEAISIEQRSGIRTIVKFFERQALQTGD